MKLYVLTYNKDLQYNKIQKYSSYVSAERKKKINSYQNENSKINSLLSELLLRYILKKDYAFADVDIKTTNLGKPYLNNNSNIHFSISHSANAVAIAIDQSPVGIDIEKIEGPNTDITNFFATAEQNYINSSSDKTSAFYEIWTQKEAYVKMKGTGFINTSPSDFDVTQKKHLLFTKKVGTYMLSVCSKSNLSSNICTKTIDLSDVLIYFDNL